MRNGGHHIPDDVVERRYYAGIYNLINLYIPICDIWLVVNNASNTPELVCQGEFDGSPVIYNYDIWDTIKRQGDDYKI